MTAEEIRTALLNDASRWVTPEQFGKAPKYLHVVINGDNDTMLEVAKQMALLAHFPSFDENNPKTCTLITIVGDRLDEGWKAVFGNLLIADTDWISLPLDISVEHVSPSDWEKRETEPQYVYAEYSEEDLSGLIKGSSQDYSSEHLAMRVNAVYEESQRFDIIRAEDIKHIQEFSVPVKHFVELPKSHVAKAWKALNADKQESSRAMAHSMFMRMKSLQIMKKVDDKSLYDTLTRNLVAFSQSEHARWNVEKLINGFRPYTMEEVIEDENSFGDTRQQRKAELKDNLVHIDLCSYNRLRRIDLNSIKYDSFLLLAMVKYWEKNLKFQT